MWLKYADHRIMSGEQWNRAQSAPRSHYDKPRGFWFTDDSEDCWASWCRAENFCLEALTFKHEVKLDESKLLILRTGEELDQFLQDFTIYHSWHSSYTDRCINWPEVAKQYAGIIITPYQWSHRLSHDSNWYYGWDCASGCVWDASAILSINLIDINEMEKV